MQERTAGCKGTSSISLRILSAGCHDMLYMSYASLLHKTFHNHLQKRFTYSSSFCKKYQTAGTSCIASKTHMAGITAHCRAFFSTVCILSAKRDFAYCTCVLGGSGKLYGERKVLFHGLQLQSARTAVQKATAHILRSRELWHTHVRAQMCCALRACVCKTDQINLVVIFMYK